MNHEKQPEALQLAQFFESMKKSSHRWHDSMPIHEKTSAELRRLHCRVQELEAELVKEAARTAEEKLRADQMSQQHSTQSALNSEARKELAEMKAPQAVQPAVPFMHGIADGCGNAYFEEGCVAPEARDLQPEVDGLNRCLDEDERPYSVVPLYAHPAAQGMDADSFAQTISDWPHGDAEDAARYHWLREQHDKGDDSVTIFIGDEQHGPGHLDAQIDEAIAAQAKQGG